MDFVDFDF